MKLCGNSSGDSGVRRGLRRSNRRRLGPEAKRTRVRNTLAGTLGFVARLLGAVVLVAGVFGMVLALYGWATTSPRFAVTEVRFQGIERAAIHELAPLTGIKQGHNIFMIDVDKVEEQLIEHPWVQSVVVRRDPPNHVFVALREYEPAALVLFDSLYLADPMGTVFKPATAGEELDLPIISGVDVNGGDEPDRDEIMRGLDLIASWRAAGPPGGMELSQVHLDPIRGFSLTAVDSEGENPVIVHFAEKDLSGRLSRFSSLLELLSETGERPREVFLNNHRRPQWVVARVEE